MAILRVGHLILPSLHRSGVARPATIRGACAILAACGGLATASDPGSPPAAEFPPRPLRLQVLGHEPFLASPRAGVAVFAVTSYVRPDGLSLIGYHSEESKSDRVDICWKRFSDDNGATWSEPVPFPTCEEHADGTLRRHMRGSYLDPPSGRLITLWTEGVLPTDEPLEGMRHYTVHYAVSANAGRTELARGPIVQAGDGFSAEHPLPGVWRGRNCVMIGDFGCTPLTLGDGTLLVPCQISPVGSDGAYRNPGGGYTYTDAAVIRGRWQPDLSIAWELSAPVAGDPARSTRGMIEPTLGVLADGRVLMVMRGSNGGTKDPQFVLPGHRWHALSADGGRTWTAPEPWTYDDGQPFFSPSACSQIVRHSNGGLFWIGNICPRNPQANGPRYPLVIGEVDPHTGLLRRDSVVTIDDRHSGEADSLTLSNFFAREDLRTRNIVIHLTRLFTANGKDWTADALLHRVAVEEGEGSRRHVFPQSPSLGSPPAPGSGPPP